MILRPPSLTKSLLTLIIGFTFAGLVIIFAVTIPTMRRIVELRANIASTEQDIEAQYQRIHLIKQSIKELPTIVPEVNQYADSTVPTQSELTLITLFESLATANSISSNCKIDYADSVSKEKNGIVPTTGPYYVFSCANIGTFENHWKYLRQIEDLPQYANIRRLRFERRRQSGDGAVTETLSFDAYFSVHDPIRVPSLKANN